MWGRIESMRKHKAVGGAAVGRAARRGSRDVGGEVRGEPRAGAPGCHPVGGEYVLQGARLTERTGHVTPAQGVTRGVTCTLYNV